MKHLILGIVLAVLGTGELAAQSSQSSANLVFPAEALEGSAAIRKLGTVLAKPAGPGPFPAVVIMQTCSGATADQREWGRRAVNRGFVALVVDSMTPRGVTNNCNLPLTRRMLDARDAREHLKQFNYVDPARIGLMGFSAGATTALLITTGQAPFAQSPSYMPFAAVVTFYGACLRRGPEGLENIFQNRTPDAPLLMLMGGEDPQGRPGDCIPELERLKSAGAEVEWNVYPHATHCFDCESENGRVAENTLQGGRMSFSYDKAATADAADRAFAFLAERMKKAQ